MDPKAFHTLSYGVYIVSTWDEGRATGCTANSAIQVTSSPATVLVSINKDNYTNRCIAACGHFALSVLAENSDPAIIGTFGFRSGKDFDKFQSVAWSVRDKMPVVSDACAYICCRVIGTMDTATHTVFLGEVVGAEKLSDVRLLPQRHQGQDGEKRPDLSRGGNRDGQMGVLCLRARLRRKHSL